MLLLLTFGLWIASLLVLCTKKNLESLLLMAMCLSLTFYMVGLMLYIAKKGGYSPEIMNFLFLTPGIRLWFQYRFITLGQMGYLIALGRYLFPAFFLGLSMQYSMLPQLRKSPLIFLWLPVLPILSLIVYAPPIYRWLIQQGSWIQEWTVFLSYLWIIIYLGLAWFLLWVEFFSITMKFCRQQFIQIAVCLMALSILYLLYCQQDPGQVYRFYSYNYHWIKGTGYLQYNLGLSGYWLLVVTNLICGVLGIVSLWNYTQDNLLLDRDEVVLNRKFDVARMGASVFVHSIKNQLLANRVLHKRLRAELEQPCPDLSLLAQYANRLCHNNEQLIARSEELYRTVKAKSVRLIPTTLGQLAQQAASRFYAKYPEGLLEIQVEDELQVLADETYLSEALYNLMINGWESNLLAEHSQSPVQLLSHQERLYTVLEVRDFGTGIPRQDQKHIFEPFYSSKNSNFNWGMGLYHVRTIVRSHLGSLRLDNRTEGGVSFYILLPRYDPRGERRNRI